MILPIIAYGDPILRKKAKKLPEDYHDLQGLVDNMFESMYTAKGVGLAAPQVGLSIRLFILDTDQMEEEDRDQQEGIKKVFINPQIEEVNGEDYLFSEGCLSIPNIREEIIRPEVVRIKYHDVDFKEYNEEYDGLIARVVLHEYDHLEGVLFTDKLQPLKKRLLKTKLNNISKGKIQVDYRMKFPRAK
ncbi:MAG: peptide deformylase [Bacteroidetes bacterium]|nr:peptide deformylase [Bacteroidota bacterium]